MAGGVVPEIQPLTLQSGATSFLDWASPLHGVSDALGGARPGGSAGPVVPGAGPAAALARALLPLQPDVDHVAVRGDRGPAPAGARLEPPSTWRPPTPCSGPPLPRGGGGGGGGRGSWDGSEAMAARSRAYCRRTPSGRRVGLLSSDTAKTVVATLQGCQSIVCMFVPVKPTTLETVYYPLAIFGLARLFSALWLTSEFDFAPLPDLGDPHYHRHHHHHHRRRKSSIDSLIEPVAVGDYDGLPAEEDGRFRPTSFWGSRAMRALFCALLLFLLVKGVLNMSRQWVPCMSATEFAIGVFYDLLLAASFAILTYYFVRNGAESTIIPCISSAWYKVYTALLMAAMVLMLVLAAIETRKTPCGLYTTFPGYEGDGRCAYDYPAAVPVEPRGIDYTGYGYGQFGLATNFTLGTAQAEMKLKEGEFLVDEFTGLCLGQFTGTRRICASTLETIAST